MIRSSRIRYAAILTVLAITLLASWSCKQAESNPQAKYGAFLCSAHGVTDSLCAQCHPDLIPMFKARFDWCAEHNTPESQCVLCHPDLKLKQSSGHEGHDHGDTEAADWCEEHRVPESQCTKCHPELATAFKAKGDWCAEHGVPESHCYPCHPTLTFAQEPPRETPSREAQQSSLFRFNKKHCATDDAVVQLTSSETSGRIGLELEPVMETVSGAEIGATGEVEFDARATTAVTSLVSGTLVKWLVDVGDAIRKGQTLAYLESLDGANLKSQYAHSAAVFEPASAEFERQKQLFEGGMSSQREYQDAHAEFLRAQADYQQAAGALKALGYADAELKELLVDENAAWIPIRARNSGVLVEQRVALGEVLAAGTSVGLLAERNRFWVEAFVRDKELERVRVGMQATLSSDGDGLGRTAGVVTWVAESVDRATRMGRVRIQPEVNGSQLYAHQFVEVQISAGDEPQLIVPRDAVQWEGCCNIVFVSETADRFRPRKVTVSFADRDHYAVTGLKSGEYIVTKGSYLLKTELMKEGLGAGCCGEGA